MAARIDSLSSRNPDKIQIIHSRVRELDPDKKRILVLHDLAQDPENDHLKNDGHQKFDALVFVSYWQREQYRNIFNIPTEKTVVIENAIEPIPFLEKATDKITLIYFSTPHRGLTFLPTVFKHLQEKHENIELKVFSSFDLYDWGVRDQQYLPFIEQLKQTPNVTYSKSVPNNQIREELQKSHILAFPSIWPETSCLCLIEAMAAGLVCVHSSLAALPETSCKLTAMYDYHEDPSIHIQRFYHALDHVITNYSLYSPKYVASIANQIYDWNTVASFKWNNLLISLSN